MTIPHVESGRVYRAVNPREVKDGFRRPSLVNDRVVLRINKITHTLQYDGPAVANGRHYPTTTVAAFVKWAAADVTDEMPGGSWQRWPIPTPEELPARNAEIVQALKEHRAELPPN